MDLPQFLMGIGSMVAGISSLRNAFKKNHRGRVSGLGRLQLTGEHRGVNGQAGAQIYKVNTIDERLAGVARQMMASVRDPRVRQLAVSIVSRRSRRHNNDNGDGGWAIPERDYWGEVKAIFNWMRANVRYIRDTSTIDTFATAMRTIEAHGGDCLPEGTLLVTPLGLKPIEDIEVGDTIHDGKSWVKVEKKWDKGVLPVYRFKLNNGCTLSCTGDHDLLRVKKENGETIVEETLAKDLRPGEDLFQPRDFECGTLSLNEHRAVIIGAYVAEGWSEEGGRWAIAGVPNGKGLRERVLASARALGIEVSESDRYIRFRAEDRWLIAACGTRALNKALPPEAFSWDRETIGTVLGAMEQGDGGMSTSGTNMVYSTISPVLAVQYRVLKRMLGFSTSIKKLDDHGGLGTHPIYRVTVREDHRRRPWAKVKSISKSEVDLHCYDIKTTTGVIYLPESDVRTRNCDDYTIALGALLMSIGYSVRMKTIQTKDADDWNHIYLQVGLPPGKATKWRTLDASVAQPAGWEAPSSIIAKSRVDAPEDPKWRSYF